METLTPNNTKTTHPRKKTTQPRQKRGRFREAGTTQPKTPLKHENAFSSHLRH